MSGSLISVPNQFQSRHCNLLKPTPRAWHKSCMVRCCKGRAEKRLIKEKIKNHYELLGISSDSTSQEIKDAYRKLQKIYHPDIAGEMGHEHTLKLNEAYKVLKSEDLRRNYDATIGNLRLTFGKNKARSSGYSLWNGPLRPQALFVDENACIGCRECVHHASQTFTMDETLGCARVSVQYGDDDVKIEVSVLSCPVNCIHWVDSEELPLLELLIKPQPKEGHGIYGQGWDRPKNVFMAAKVLKKQLKQEATYKNSNARQDVDEETPAQSEARVNASIKLKMESFSKAWNWINDVLGH